MKRTRVYVIALFVLLLLNLAGCGGGNGKGSAQTPAAPPDNSQPVTPPTILPTEREVTVQPDGSFKAEIKSFTIEGQPGTLKAETIVAVKETSADTSGQPINPEFDNKSVEISSNIRPNASISIVANDAIQVRGLVETLYLLIRWSGEIWDPVAEDKLGRFNISPDEFDFDGKASVVVSKTTVYPVSMQTRLVPVIENDSSATLKTDALVLLPGFGQNADALMPLAQRLIGQYKSIYIWEYDTGRGCKELGDDFKKVVLSFQNQGKTTDLLPYSMGAVVARSAIENDPQITCVKHLVSICGAHLGSKWATAGEFLLYLQKEYLNRITGSSFIANRFPTIDVASIHDLTPGSAFLSQLNTPSSYRIRCNYSFLVAEDDGVVADARKLCPLDFSQGSARTFTYGYGLNHKTIISSKLGLDSMVSAVIIAANNDNDY